MAASKRQMNWTAVTFTPTSGSPIVIDGVTGIAPDNGGNILKFSADGDRYTTLAINDMTDPTFNLTVANINAANQLVPGLRGTFSATWNDARNGATPSGGALIYTITNAVVGGNSATGQHRQIGSATVEINCESSDGVTSPVSVAAA